MIWRLLLIISIVMFLLISVHACKDTGGKEQPAVFKQVLEIQEIKPQKPVKIKLKRNTKGKYSWDISGNNAYEVLETDKKLRKGLEKKGGEDET